MNSTKPILCILLTLLSFYNTHAQYSFQKRGYASFYDDKFNGRKTSSGEIFSQKKLTCAHLTLPFGTKLKVTNLSNDKSVVVAVNDRGPFFGKRIIDLTRAAAKKLDFISSGEIKVEIEIVNSEESTDSTFVTNDTIMPFYKIEFIEKPLTGYSIKIATYLSEEKTFEVAQELKQQLDRDIFVQTIEHKKKRMFRIFAGRFTNRQEAEKLIEKVKPLYPDCYVVELLLSK